MKSETISRYNKLLAHNESEVTAIADELISESKTFGEAIDVLECLTDQYDLVSSIHAAIFEQMKKQAIY